MSSRCSSLRFKPFNQLFNETLKCMLMLPVNDIFFSHRQLRKRTRSSGGRRPGPVCSQCWTGSSTPMWPRTLCFFWEMVYKTLFYYIQRIQMQGMIDTLFNILLTACFLSADFDFIMVKTVPKKLMMEFFKDTD